jgi:pectinesterase
MKPELKIIVAILLLAVNAKSTDCQTPTIGRSWQSVATRMPDEWYGSEESIRVAENVLLYQRDAGGWPKNIAIHKPISQA